MSTPLTPQVQTPQVNPVAANIWAPNILIVGPSGSGKSTSVENLPKDESTGLILTENKALPFINTFTNVKLVETHGEFTAAVDELKKNLKVRRIFIDSITKHLERCLQFCRQQYKGYDIWTMYGRMGTALFNALCDKRVVIIATSIDENVELEGVDAAGAPVTNYKRMAATLMGNELRGKIEKEFLIVAHTQIKNEAGKNQFLFNVKPNQSTTSKSPKQMFPNTNTCPNDLMIVLKEIETKLNFPCL